MKQKILLLLFVAALLGSVFLINDLYISNQPEPTSDTVDNNPEDNIPTAEQEEVREENHTISEYPVDYDMLFDNSIRHHFKIVISKEEFDGLSSDMVNFSDADGNMRTGDYRKADLYYTDEKGEVKIGEVGIRTKGNMSRTLPKDADGLHRFHFKIKFDETFDIAEGSVDYNIRSKRKFADMSELNFKINDGTDPTNIREIFCYDLIGDFGVTTPKASMATLTFVIDGVEHDYGVVRYIESVDKDFLKQRLGGKLNDGNLYKCLWQNFGPASLMPLERDVAIGVKDWEKNYRPTYDRKTNKDDINYQDIKDFIDNINKLDGADLKAYLDKNFNVDSFIKAQALDVALGEIDGYWSMGNNYYLYFNEDGIIEWIPFDYEHILAAGWNGDPYWSYEGIATADIFKWNNLNAKMYNENATHPLMDKILKIDEYKSEYVQALRELTDPANNYFTYSRFMDMYNELYALYGNSVDNEMKEGNVWTLSNEEWYFSTKIDSINTQLKQSAK